jgi:hypothetical protein
MSGRTQEENNASTPWAMVGYVRGEKDVTFVMGRFPTLMECNRYKGLMERAHACKWNQFSTSQVLDCRGDPYDGPPLTCEQRPPR